jgi:hypothetical protein
MAKAQYKLSIKFEGDRLSARARGERTRATVTAITMAVYEAALARETPKVLIDVREMQGQLSILDSYLVVTQVFEKLRRGPLHKAAIVDVQISSRRGWFIETVARNRGFNIRVFADPEQALAWLEA